MASYSSFTAGLRSNPEFDFDTSTTRKPNGRFWNRPVVNAKTAGRPVFSLRSLFTSNTAEPSMPSFTDLSQQASPISPLGFVPTPDYADKGFRRFHQHSISDSTATFGSTDSSPTTTCSTVDDSSATEPSPGSSPESPPPSSYEGSMLRPHTSSDYGTPFFELQRAPPLKKGRNLKNLAVNTSTHNARAASTSSLPLSIQPTSDSEPSMMSPSFTRPPAPPKRKPSNLGLTILTPATTNPETGPMKLAIPPTPGFGRPATLRHFQSSPSLPLFPASVSIGRPSLRLGLNTTLETILSPIAPPQVQIQTDDEQNFDVPLSREEKPEAYPDGPITVYEPHIDLYLEPTAAQASKYDVVMNVASEVRNPFTDPVPPSAPEPEMRLDGGGGIQFAPRRETPIDDVRQPSSPTTPKATPLNASFPHQTMYSERQPEYIHIPWEHNSDIVPDLFRLVKLMDERVQEGKSVLVHCQCGVSRSASLVVAYGLYKDPSMSVQEAYDAVKQRSKWIGPNMNLIMQLQEFRSSLARGGLLPDNRGLSPITPSSAFGDWPGPFSGRALQVGPHAGNLTAPGPGSIRPPTSGSLPALSPTPSSAPLVAPWLTSTTGSKQIHSEPESMRVSSPYVDTSGHVVPILKVVEPERIDSTVQTSLFLSEKDNEATTPTGSMPSPRSAEFAMTDLKPPAEVDSEDAFGLMSPTATEFKSSPFDRPALLAQLGMGSMRQQDDLPLRTRSLRSATPQPNAHTNGQNLQTPNGRRLRGKISSPSLREQQQLRQAQADIESKLHREQQSRLVPQGSTEHAFGGLDDALMSPRATEFTQNHFATLAPISTEASVDDGAPRTVDLDPRSPAQVGVSPITRNIGDVL
ncbi:hypothetical protein B0A48_13563 [Cryoendolithus antarcticus]|uniref:protein-tyrosine-phosphatase n=1 Tax=Cryoendolithus antarcticus TaxID=1507870 RepID=A0A1V8SNY4_9PEZI|nr:hypothetical protein B0A48_13563 [Cryoendolithus antarcticus]